MCGIIGGAGNIDFTGKKILKDMFYVNTLRGVHGCGLFSLFEDTVKGEKGDYYVLKKWEEPSNFISMTNEWTKAITTNNNKVVIGHSRSATVGDIKTENNHPFKAGHIIGVHNGTIRGTFGSHSKKFDTDSEAFYNEISEHGLKKAIEIIEKDSYSAAYALAYYDFDMKTVSLYRNKERPLFLAKHKENFYWASEEAFLVFAFMRNGVEQKDVDIQEIKEHYLVRIYLEKDKPQERLKIIPNYFEPKKTPANYSNWNNRNSYYQTNSYSGSLFDDSDKKKEDKKITILKKKRKVVKVSDSLVLSSNYVFSDLLPKGCACCDTPTYNLSKIRFSKTGTEYYCESCKDIIKDGGISWENLTVPEQIEVDVLQ